MDITNAINGDYDFIAVFFFFKVFLSFIYNPDKNNALIIIIIIIIKTIIIIIPTPRDVKSKEVIFI